MWSLIKWLFFLGIIAAVVLWFTGWKVGGKTIQEHAKPVLENKMVKEGIKDIRSLLGEGLKAAGEAISEDVTDEEREQLDRVVKEELRRGKPVTMPEGQKTLTPTKGSVQYVEEQMKRPTVREMEVLPEEKAQTPPPELEDIREKGVNR
jgi:hypothetical protein